MATGHQISNVEFCRDFITYNSCWAINCKYLHSTGAAERRYKATGVLSDDDKQKWFRRQRFFKEFRNTQKKDVCWEHIVSKCFRKNCRMGRHPFLWGDTRIDTHINVTFVSSINLQEVYANIVPDAPKWSVECYCHPKTPVRFLFDYVKQSLRRAIKDPIFKFNDVKIPPNSTLKSVNITNGAEITVDIERHELGEVMIETLAEKCAICLEEPSVESRSVLIPCMHQFCKVCIDQWLIMKSQCPTCRGTPTHLRSNIQNDWIYDETEVSQQHSSVGANSDVYADLYPYIYIPNISSFGNDFPWDNY